MRTIIVYISKWTLIRRRRTLRFIISRKWSVSMKSKLVKTKENPRFSEKEVTRIFLRTIKLKCPNQQFLPRRAALKIIQIINRRKKAKKMRKRLTNWVAIIKSKLTRKIMKVQRAALDLPTAETQSLKGSKRSSRRKTESSLYPD